MTSIASMIHARHHDYNACLTTALSMTEAHCYKEGLRLTELQKPVLKLVWSSHRPMGTYALLVQIGQTGRTAAPLTVYRALEFLLVHHLIYRVASLNADMGCNYPGCAHYAQLFICSHCSEIPELADPMIENTLSREASELGFTIENQTIEKKDICHECMLRRN